MLQRGKDARRLRGNGAQDRGSIAAAPADHRERLFHRQERGGGRRAQAAASRIEVLHHTRNQGKGAALRTGIATPPATSWRSRMRTWSIRPSDLKRLVVPLIEGQADVVLGSRFLSGGSHRVLYFWHSLGNRFLTFLSNMLTDLNLTDMETCYKVFRREVIQSIEIEENRFGFEPEIVAKVAQTAPERLRDGDFLQRAHVRRRQEDRHARRLARAVLHPEIQPAQGAVADSVPVLSFHRGNSGDREPGDRSCCSFARTFAWKSRRRRRSSSRRP